MASEKTGQSSALSSASEEKEIDLAMLTDDEENVLKEQVAVQTIYISYFSLYRYASGMDILIITTSSIAAIVTGVIPPIMTIVFGSFAGNFAHFSEQAASPYIFEHLIHRNTLYFVYLGICALVANYVSVLGFNFTGERITQRIRDRYLGALLRQNIAFFDHLGAGEVTTRITTDVNLIQDGISQKVGLTISGFSGLIAALIVGFLRNWKLEIVMLSSIIALVLTMGVIGKVMKKFQGRFLNASATANSLAEEAISSMKIVSAFNMQKRLARQYDELLKSAASADFWSKAALGSMIAMIMCIFNLQYGLGFWQGSRFLSWGDADTSQIVTVILASMIAGVTFGHVVPHLGAMGAALAAARKIFGTIERIPVIDSQSQSGFVPQLVEGSVEFNHVTARYPSRPGVIALSDLSLSIPAGKVTAIVGTSGSGKSTVIGLLERFYSPVSGSITIDDIAIQDLNLKWLRQVISLVGQEPVLFNTTVYKNIEYGLMGSQYEHNNDDVKRDLIENAAKIANAYQFIKELPAGFRTRVGDLGSRLSGGQKQRIAIARAIVSDPKILLLDEATAALDTKSERAVQTALDAASSGRTTIVIAHRLSTIQSADNIVVMKEGRIVEKGSHRSLTVLQGEYCSLVRTQQLKEAKVKETRSLEDGDEVMAQDEKALVDDDCYKETTNYGTIKPQRSLDPMTLSTFSSLFRFMWRLNHDEHGILFLGFCFSIVAGTAYPVMGIFFGNAVIALNDPSASNGGHDVSFWSAMFLMQGLVTLGLYLGQGATFAVASAKLVHRARHHAFRAILRQDTAFFDSDHHSSGALVSFLATETHRLASLSGATLGALLNAAGTVASAIVIGCSFGWKLALVCISIMPVLLGCGFLRLWTLSRLEARTKQSTDASRFAHEATTAIRTVASFTLEKQIMQEYHDKLETQGHENFRFAAYSSLVFAFSQSFLLFAMALAFWYGGTLILRHEYNVRQFFICLFAVIWGAQAAGGVFSYAQDADNARSAAEKLKRLLDTEPKIDTWSEHGKTTQDFEGRLEMRDLTFAYPSRDDRNILKSINLRAAPGQFVALVGPSGSGKSTVMALLERFYDPSSGQVLIDGQDIRQYNLLNYRNKLALVSQDSLLFSGTIRENITAGAVNKVDDELIISVCKDANIWDFISSLPSGLSTSIGSKGTLLSGGQRQRLAIARALLRDPKLLLLDEATSSLDSNSEELVQEALDRAAKGRTTIAIAHRLSTVRKADCIYVLDEGRIVEKGTHEELLARRGMYWDMWGSDR